MIRMFPSPISHLDKFGVVLCTSGDRTWVALGAQVHVYLTGSCKALDAARDATIKSHGISVFDRTRGPGVGDGSEQCFEFKMGPRNMAVPNDVFVNGWLAFVQQLGKQED